MSYPENSVGRLIEPITIGLKRDSTVSEAVDTLCPHAQPQQLAYAYVVDDEQHLVGAVTMRELWFAESTDLIESVMVIEPFYFTSATPVVEAMRAVLSRHYPMYPVCDASRKSLGVVRGHALLNGSADPAMLAGIVIAVMLGSCAAAGVAGVLIPLTLRRFGADPATASTIFLTTATDVVSMGTMLGLATILLL